MTQEQINQLAREYASNGFPQYADKTQAKLCAIHVIEWLLRDHLIANKSLAIDCYQIACADAKSNDYTTSQSAHSEKQLLEVIFGKSTFNPTER